MADVKINLQVVGAAAKASLSSVARAADEAEKEVSQLNVGIKNTTSAFKVFGGLLLDRAFGALTSSVGGFVRAIKTNTEELEKTSTQFEVLTGSAANAQKVISDLQDFTARTPFQFEQVSTAASRLLAFGTAADDLLPRLQQIGDVSAAVNKPIADLATIFGQVQAEGRLTGERLRQLQESAVPIGPALAQTLGVAETSLRDLVSQGKVTFEVFDEAFKSLSAQGGPAFEGLVKQSRTLGGLISTVKDNFVIFTQVIGQQLLPAAKALAVTILETLQGFIGYTKAGSGALGITQKFSLVVQAAVGVVGLLGEGLNAARVVFNVIASVVNAAASAVFRFAEIIVSAIEGVARLGSGLPGVGKQFEGIAQTVDSFRETLKNLREATAETSGEFLAGAAEATSSFGNSLEASNQFTESFIENLRKQEDAANQTSGAIVSSNQKQVQSEQEKRSLIEALQLAKTNDDILTQQEEAAREQLSQDESFARLEEFLGKRQAAQVAARAQELLAEGKFLEAAQELQDARFKAEQESNKEELQAEQLARIEEQRVQSFARQLIAEDRYVEARKALRESDIKDQRKIQEIEGQINQAQLNAKRSTLSQIATLQNSNNKALATIGRAAALTQIAIEGPVAVTRALAAFPPPFNFAAAAAVGAAVAAQAAQVAGLKFADGGIVPGNSFVGDRVAAQVNSGEMILNREQQARLFEIANNGAAGGQVIQTSITVELDGDVVGRAVSRRVADGLQLGEVV